MGKSNVFNEYASFYDILYEDKDYKAECEFIKRIIEKYSDITVKSILDLGAGTGSHALFFDDMGYKVTAVDISDEMLDVARKKSTGRNIEYIQGDIRELNLGRKFDAVVSMFAVMSYQTTNDDFEKAIKTAQRHLKKGGLFIFDVWFGPAVLLQKPEVRIKTIENMNERIVREAKPRLDVKKQIVDVEYTLRIFNGNKIINEIKEAHSMRFFFYQELVCFIEKNGFELINITPFMRINKKVDENSWNINVIARR